MTTFGLSLPHYDGFFPDSSTRGARRTSAAIDVAVCAEDLGFEAVWVSDHLGLAVDGGPVRRSPDCWTLLAAIATETSTIRVGSLVSNASLRPPAILAHQVKTVLDLAGPRVDVGLGAGWNHDEYTTAGLAFPSVSKRLAAVRDTAAALRKATGDSMPPLWVGGKRSGILAVTAEISDGWNLAWDPDPCVFDVLQERLRALAQAAGRPTPRMSVGLTTVIGWDEADLRRRWEQLRQWVPGGYLDEADFEQWRARGLVGTVATVRARAVEWANRGVDHIVCAFGMPFGLFDAEQLDLAREALELEPRVVSSRLPAS